MLVEVTVLSILRYWFLSTWLDADRTRSQWYLPIVFDYSDDNATITVSDTAMLIGSAFAHQLIVLHGLDY